MLAEFISKDYLWVAEIGGIALIVFLTLYIESLVYKRLYPKFQKTKRIWDNTLLKALHAPIRMLICALGLILILLTVQKYFDNKIFQQMVPLIQKIVTVVVFVWVLIRLIREIEMSVIQRKTGTKRLDLTSIRAISQLCRLVVWITAILTVLQAFGVPLSGVIAFGGVGGIAVGFAAKDLLSNLFGSMMIFLDRPFKIGDWIRSPDRDIEGVVENIGWRLTRIRTFDKRPLFVPNGIFSNISIENPSRMENRRIRTILGIRYQDADKLPLIIKEIETMLIDHEEVDSLKTLYVRLHELGPSSVNFIIYAFIKKTDIVGFQTAQQEVFFKVLEIIGKHKAQLALPSMTVYNGDPSS